MHELWHATDGRLGLDGLRLPPWVWQAFEVVANARAAKWERDAEEAKRKAEAKGK